MGVAEAAVAALRKFGYDGYYGMEYGGKTNDPAPIDLPETKRNARRALEAIYPEDAGDFTQALMELGATLCGPNRKPRCEECPCREICLGFRNGTAETLPIKAPKKEKRQEDRTVFILSCDGRYALEKRPSRGLLAGLWQFPNISGHFDTPTALLRAESMGIGVRQIYKEISRKHIFTHIIWDMKGIYLEVAEPTANFRWFTEEEINTMLAAVMADGNTVIHNAAKEPHIVDLANFLSSMGASVKGAGTDIIRIRGGRPLHGTTYAVIPDQIETGTLMIAAAATKGDVVITDAIPYHMEALSAKLLEMGVYVNDEDDRIHVRYDGVMRPINVKTQVYPGFPTDLQQPMTAMLAIAGGTSVVTENIFESRFRYVEELRRMGANIRVVDRVAIIDGVNQLVGAPITTPDLRAGAAMIVAGLIAEGTTEISGVHFIRRGYEHIDSKLRQLGARVEWVSREVNDY